MPEGYEVVSVREITDVDPATDELLDYIEAHAKTTPHGVAIMVRVPSKGAAAADVGAALAAKAREIEAIFGP